MIDLTKFEFWFVTGSQSLYGDETLRQVAEDSKKMVSKTQILSTVKHLVRQQKPLRNMFKKV